MSRWREGHPGQECPGAAITMTKSWWLQTREILSLKALRPEVKIKVQGGLGSPGSPQGGASHLFQL